MATPSTAFYCMIDVNYLKPFYFFDKGDNFKLTLRAFFPLARVSALLAEGGVVDMRCTRYTSRSIQHR
eukprot:15027607-Heterocapsa_arctica.AAC.1